MTDTSTAAASDRGVHGVEAQPDDAYFDLMARIAEDHWWYRARRDWLAQELGPRLPRGEIAVDVGCGTGEAMAVVERLGARVTVGSDLSEHVLGYVVRRSPGTKVAKALADGLPWPDAAAGAVVSMDVIEHLDDDRAALREYHRVLRPGGVLYISVPSYQWLWGVHDDVAAHRRRYAGKQFTAVVEGAGFEIERQTCIFTFLVPPAILLRRTPLKRLVKATDDEVSMMHPIVEATFAAFARAERWVGRRRRIPFGLSMVIVAHKPVGA
jgi:SAM-dependent methyltransferase